MRFFFYSLIARILLGAVASGKAYAQYAQIVGLWHFDEGSGNVAKDSSGNGSHGEIIGGKWVDGRIGKALEFDGTDQTGVLIEHNPSQILTEQVTIEAWVMALSSPPPTTGNIVRKGIYVSGQPTTGWALDVNENLSVRGFVYLVPAKASLVDPKAVALELAEWHHLALTYDGEEVIVYVDGEVYGTLQDSGKLLENEEPLAIGIRPNLERAFTGVIDEVVVWGVARTQDEVKQDMNGVSAVVRASDKLAIPWGEIRTR